MSTEDLGDVISLALWAGQMLLQNGADSQRIEETVHRLGTALGCDWLDVIVHPDAIIATSISNEEFRTKVRRAPLQHVDLEVIQAIGDLSYRVGRGEVNREEMRAELRRIADASRHYNLLVTASAIGLACASLSRLFGGDWVDFAVTFAAASGAMVVRHWLTQHYFNQLLVTVVTAFVAGIIGSADVLVGGDASNALAASVLLLAPGVPLLNSAEDLINGYLLTGLLRAVYALLVALSIALGLSIAIGLTHAGLS